MRGHLREQPLRQRRRQARGDGEHREAQPAERVREAEVVERGERHVADSGRGVEREAEADLGAETHPGVERAAHLVALREDVVDDPEHAERELGRREGLVRHARLWP